MQFGYVPPRHAIAENLLINPRGKINQANEPDGVIAAGDYFCDGWKAGPAGCEVYIEPDGFRLVSGSMLQLIPNTLESDRLIRTNLDVISGSPVIKVNGVADKNTAGVGEYIEIEISGLNSKFSRIIAADSKAKPIYQQSVDEEKPCMHFFQKINLGRERGYSPDAAGLYISKAIKRMHKPPAGILFDVLGTVITTFISTLTIDTVCVAYVTNGIFDVTASVTLDARP